MKKVFVTMCTVFCFSLIALNVMAYPVNIISSNSHVEGSYSAQVLIGTDLNGDNVFGYKSDNYDKAGTTPQSGEVSCYGFVAPTIANSSSYLFGVSAYASAEWIYDHADAYASAEWEFRPVNEVDQLTINVVGHDYFAVWVKIEDLTLGTELWGGYYGGSMYHNGGGGEYPNRSNDLIYGAYGESANPVIASDLTPDHTYLLYFSALGNANDDSDGAYIKVLDMTVVPEPTTLLLLGLGLMGLAGVSRKFKKKELMST